MALFVAAAVAGAGSLQTLARAQTTDGPRRDVSVITLDPVNVTARKIEEAQQDVPISITVLGEQARGERRIDDVESVLRQVPGVGFSAVGDGRSTFLSIRGIGPISQPLGYDDTSTVTYVDGVPQPLFGSDLAILDAERIEVMRGPQGTVFGRNAQAGAINIVTRRPGDQAEVTARGELGSDWHRRGHGAVSGPLIGDVLAGRLAVFYAGVDGDVGNIAPGTDDLGDMETGALRGSLVATPGSDTRITLSLFGQRDDVYQSAFFAVTNGTRNNAYSTDSYAVFGEATVPAPGIEGLNSPPGCATRATKRTSMCATAPTAFPERWRALSSPARSTSIC